MRVHAAIALAVCFHGALATEAASLAPGATRSETGARTLEVSLDAGQAVALTLRQEDPAAIELRWSTSGATAKTLRTEAGRGSMLRVPLVADTKTTWTIAVAPASAKSIRYTIALTPAHRALAADRSLSISVDALADAEALRAKGDKSVADEARKLYTRAIDAAANAGDACAVRHASVALSGLEHEIVDAGAQKAAADAALAQTCDENVADRALAERLSGSASINQGDFTTGTRETEKAVASFRETGDIHQQGIALRNLGLAYTESGEIEKGLATTRRALKAVEGTDDVRLLTLIRTDLAFMHNARGEFALAIDAYRKTLDTLQANPYPMVEAVAWINLGIAYGQLGDGEQAMAAYAKAEPVAKSVDCWSCLAEIDVDRGDDLLDSGDVTAAQAAYQRALDVANAHDLVRQRAEAFRGLGRCAMAASDWPRARTLFESAREELHRTGGRVNESVAYAMLGDLESRLGNLDAARTNYGEALKLAREADNQAWQAVAHASLARIAEASHDLETARGEIGEALALIESERTRIGAPDLRTSYFGTKRAYYALDVDILMQLDRLKPDAGYAAQALVAAERARARELQDQLAGRAINVDRDVDPALLGAEREASDRLHALAYQLSQLGEGDAAKRPALVERIDEASRALDAARGRIRAANPRYAELTHPAAPTIEEIRRELLDDRVVAVEYWLGDERSYLWVVSRDALHAFTLPPRSEIEASARALRERILAPANIAASTSIEQRAAAEGAGLDATRAAAASLAAAILPADARRLFGNDVALVADGELLTLPFAVFDDAASPRAYAYLPSLGTLRGLRALTRSPAAEKAIAIIADPVFRADDERLKAHADAAKRETSDALVLRAASEAGIANLPRLPHTRDEAEAIAKLADRGASWVALDFAANRAAAIGADWKRYGIAHFATHALVNDRHPELSGIVLSLYDRNGNAEDGFLRVDDLYNLHLPADLVVLSVCESAVGKSVGGEGPANLARAFFYAGSPRVVASLWPVDDRASVAFMSAFYASLLEKGSRRKTRSSMRRMRCARIHAGRRRITGAVTCSRATGDDGVARGIAARCAARATRCRGRRRCRVRGAAPTADSLLRCLRSGRFRRARRCRARSRCTADSRRCRSRERAVVHARRRAHGAARSARAGSAAPRRRSRSDAAACRGRRRCARGRGRARRVVAMSRHSRWRRARAHSRVLRRRWRVADRAATAPRARARDLAQCASEPRAAASRGARGLRAETARSGGAPVMERAATTTCLRSDALVRRRNARHDRTHRRRAARLVARPPALHGGRSARTTRCSPMTRLACDSPRSRPICSTISRRTDSRATRARPALARFTATPRARLRWRVARALARFAKRDTAPRRASCASIGRSSCAATSRLARRRVRCGGGDRDYGSRPEFARARAGTQGATITLLADRQRGVEDQPIALPRDATSVRLQLEVDDAVESARFALEIEDAGRVVFSAADIAPRTAGAYRFVEAEVPKRMLANGERVVRVHAGATYARTWTLRIRDE